VTASDGLLVIEGLSKTFRRGFLGRQGELRAVHDLTLSVPRGAIYGFLGPNGAGKSTTLRMALGLIHPTEGRVLIGGHNVAFERMQALRLVGAFVESPSFYHYLSGRRNLELLAGLSGGVSREELDGILNRVGLSGRADDLVRVYSHGMRARLGLASCLLPRPELLILDEPTDGLDPHGIREVRDLIRSLARDDGLTVFLSSHMLDEVEHLCTHIAIIDQGQRILQGELAALERQHRCWRLESPRAEDAAALLARQMALNVKPTPACRDSLDAMLNGRAPEDVLRILAEAGIPVRSFAPEPHWLDRLFLELTRSHETDLRAAKGVA
jgi:ABC-type multidrug transport system ATPase subunit